jgi:hypothetical protein
MSWRLSWGISLVTEVRGEGLTTTKPACAGWAIIMCAVSSVVESSRKLARICQQAS